MTEKELVEDKKWFNERICPVCKKTFFVSPEYVYKIKRIPVCSWHCMRKGVKPGD